MLRLTNALIPALQWRDEDERPPAVFNRVTHEAIILNGHTAAALTVSQLTWMPNLLQSTVAAQRILALARRVNRGQLSVVEFEAQKAAILADPSLLSATQSDLYLIGAAPVKINITVRSAATGAIVNNGLAPFYELGANKTAVDAWRAAQEAAGNTVVFETQAAIAITLTMRNYADIMTQATPMIDQPSVSGSGVGASAHTSIYDFHANLLLATSYLAFDKQYDSATHTQYEGGSTPFATLNVAFNAIDLTDALVQGQITILFEKGSGKSLRTWSSRRDEK